MRIEKTEISDVVVINPDVFKDDRGFFMEFWNAGKYREAGIDVDFVQDNHSKSVRGTLRGLHYQVQQPQGKLIKVVNGRIFDVVVDMRRGSATFGKWVGRFLSARNRKMLWVPGGFAHGFYVTSREAEVIYKCTDFYAPAHERTLLWNDGELGIQWPLLDNTGVAISAKDARGVAFQDAEYYE